MKTTLTPTREQIIKNTMNRIICIDPGSQGSFTIIDKKDDGTSTVWVEHIDSLIKFIPFFREATSVTLEKVHSSPQMGVASAFSFGESFGFIRGVLKASGITFEELSPQVWQAPWREQLRGKQGPERKAALFAIAKGLGYDGYKYAADSWLMAHAKAYGARQLEAIKDTFTVENI
jgi:hypothetical protein